MKKSYLLIGIILIIGLFLVGCATNTQTTPTNNNPTENIDDSKVINTQSETDVAQKTEEIKSNTKVGFSSIDELLAKLGQNYKLGEKEETYYQMIGAYDGTKIDVDEIKIEIYQYKDSQKEAMISAQDSMDTADNQIFVVDENFLILVHSKDTEFFNNLNNILN
jgi:hypothetical protein